MLHARKHAATQKERPNKGMQPISARRGLARPIREDWARFSEWPFPSLEGTFDVDDVCLVSADSALAGCISTFCSRSSSGRLDSERAEILRRAVADLERTLARMPMDVERYFRELLSIARAVIAEMEA
jgi:hypothetical protein